MKIMSNNPEILTGNLNNNIPKQTSPVHEGIENTLINTNATTVITNTNLFTPTQTLS